MLKLVQIYCFNLKRFSPDDRETKPKENTLANQTTSINQNTKKAREESAGRKRVLENEIRWAFTFDAHHLMNQNECEQTKLTLLKCLMLKVKKRRSCSYRRLALRKA